MDLMLLGFLSFILAGVFALIAPGNQSRVFLNLVFQVIGAALVLSQTVAVLLGADVPGGTVQWSYPVERIDLQVDPLGAFFLTFSIPLTVLGSVFAVGYLAADIRGPRHTGTHFALLAAVQVSYLIVYTVQNAFAFLVGWEVAALSAWLLVIWNHRDQKIRFAGFNYLVSTHLSLLFLVAGVMVMHGETNSFQFADFARFLATPGFPRGLAFVLLMTAFGLKSAFFPFHTWLPRAHSAAPAHVSALMSGVIHKAGLFGMLKFVLMLDAPDRWMGWYLLVVSAASAFVGVLYSVTQRDIKRLLGYSSTENVGIVGMGFGLGCIGLSTGHPALTAFGFAGGLLHILNHAVFKCLLFFGAGAIYRFTHTIDLEKLGGLIRSMRWTAPLFLLGSLASAAMPTTNGFVSEFLIYMGLIQPDPSLGGARSLLLMAAALLALVGGISAISAARVFGLAFLGQPRVAQHVDPSAREHHFMVLPMTFLAIPILILGLCPQVGLTIVARPVAQLMLCAGTGTPPLERLMPIARLDGIALVGSLVLGLFVLLAGLRFLHLPRCDRRSVTWGCGYMRVSPRMQYTAASFSFPLVAVFRDLLRYLRREDLPQGPFPPDGKLETHCVDGVEQAVFGALQRAEALTINILHWAPENTRLSIAFGLVGLVVLALFIAVRGG